MKKSTLCLLLLIANKALGFDISSATPIDLTHDFSKDTIYWPTSKSFKLDATFHGKTDKGFFYSSNDYAASEHGGTHVDAPIHFSQTGETLDNVPLTQFMGPAVVINIQAQCKENRDYLVQVSDLERWENANGNIPNNALILLNTGFYHYWPNAKQYLGTDTKGKEGVKELSFPGLSEQAANWLVNNRQINAVGIDTASIDYGKSENYLAHQVLAKHNIPVLENVTNLDEIEDKQAYVVALPMKIKDGSGGPARIIAFIK